MGFTRIMQNFQYLPALRDCQADLTSPLTESTSAFSTVRIGVMFVAIVMPPLAVVHSCSFTLSPRCTMSARVARPSTPYGNFSPLRDPKKQRKHQQLVGAYEKKKGKQKENIAK